MRLLLTVTVSFPVLFLQAAAEPPDDPVVIPQLSESERLDPELITTEQLNYASALALKEGEVDQLSTAINDIDVSQAEGGTDLCDPRRNESYEFCDKFRDAPIKPEGARRAALPEEDYVAGSPSGVDRFSRDPSLTAELIGRGDASTLAAQSFGNDLLAKPDPEEELGPSSLNQLPPDVLETFKSGAPITPEGN